MTYIMSMSKSMSVEVCLGEVCLWACVHLMGMHLMDMYLMSMHLMGVYFLSMHLIGVYFMACISYRR